MSHRCSRHFWDRREFLFRSGGGISGLALAYLLDVIQIRAPFVACMTGSPPIEGRVFPRLSSPLISATARIFLGDATPSQQPI